MNNVQLTADSDGRILPVFHENMRQHSGGCRFAVRSADGNGAFVPFHDNAEHFGAVNLRYAKLGGAHALGVILLDCSAVNHKVAVMNIVRIVPDVNLDSHFAKLVCERRGSSVRTGNNALILKKHLRNSRHAYSADAYKINAQPFFNGNITQKNRSLLYISFKF